MAKKTTAQTNTPDDLKALIVKKREELRDLRFASEGSKNKNVKAAREMRKEIARAMTSLNAAKN